MLFKIMKYDFKDIIKKVLLYYLVFVIATVICIIFRPLLETKFQLITNMSLMIFILVTFGGPFVCLIFCMIRYFKSMVSDEGYLTHTLPVPTYKILLSKLLITLLIEVCVIVINFIIGFLVLRFVYNFIFIDSVIKFIFDEILNDHNFAIFLVLLCILLVLMYTIQICYISLCITLGGLHNKNKMIFAFLYYIGINFALQIIGTFFWCIFIIFMVDFSHDINPNFILSILNVCVGLAIMALYFIILYLLKNKLNLE